MSALKKKETLSQKYRTLSTISVSIMGICAARAMYCYIHRKYKNYPPGPIGLPFIGHMFAMLKPVTLEAYLATTYGAISMVYIAGQRWVFLHSVDSIKEIFNNEYALDRDDWYKGFTFGYLNPHELSSVVANSPFWKKKRKIMQSVLISRLDSTFLNEAHNKSVSEISKNIQYCMKRNKLWYPSNDLEYIMFNAIWSATFGSHLPPNSEVQHTISNLISRSLQKGVFDMVAMQFRLKDILPSSCFKWLVSFSDIKTFSEYVETLVYEKLKYDEDVWNMNDLKWAKHFESALYDNESCLISKLIAVHRSKPDIDSTKNSMLVDVCHSLFLAAIETTQNVAEYGLILLGKYPSDQTLIYNEIYSVFGEDWKMEQHSFKSVVYKLHYLRAFIHETLRLSAVAPFGVPHRNNRDIWTKDKKYKIPKDSIIVSDIYSANKCGKQAFCLEQWLDDRKHFSYNMNKDKMVSFSMGPRDCAGRAFALRSLYVLFIKLILRFEFKVEDKNIEIKQKHTFTQNVDPAIGLKATTR